MSSRTLFSCYVAALLAAAGASQTFGDPLKVPDQVTVTSRASIIHLGSLDSFDITEGGKQAARSLLESLETGKKEPAAAALDIYKRIIPNENFGGEYTALQWFCEYLLSPEPQQKTLRADRFTDSFYEFFAATNYTVLKRYLSRKYHLSEKEEKGVDQTEERFLEDFILFNNPRREVWEKSSKLIDCLQLKEGQVVADVGSGPGYFSFKFAERVGKKGRVYAIDTNPRHIEYLNSMITRHNIENVEPVRAKEDDIGVQQPVDLVYMCSLYHIIYAHASEAEKDRLIGSIKRVLKKDGIFALVDNALVQDTELPYHGPFVAKELLVIQMRYYGFKLVDYQQFTPQRYVLLFKQVPPEETPVARPLPKPKTAGQEHVLQIQTGKSLLHLAEFKCSDAGIAAARTLLDGLEKRDRALVQSAWEQFGRLNTVENFGGEYTALQYFCEYFLAPAARQARFVKGDLTQDYFQFFHDNDWAVLKEYLKRKYELVDMPDRMTKVGFERMNFLEDFILFNNPRREAWEKTSKIIQSLRLRKGFKIADVGSGPGYYTFQFAKIVGEEGRVYAIDTNNDHTDYVNRFAKTHGVRNVTAITSKANDIAVSDKVDCIFLCSLFVVIYTTDIEYVKDQFMDSLKRSLKPDGTLVIADNDIVDAPTLPYHGPYMDRRLIISQMKHYGFRLVECNQFTPQRYVLKFKLEK